MKEILISGTYEQNLNCLMHDQAKRNYNKETVALDTLTLWHIDLEQHDEEDTNGTDEKEEGLSLPPAQVSGA